jgi:hypothetical protein
LPGLISLRHQIHEGRKEAADGSRAAHKAALRIEQLRGVQLDAVRHSDIADHGSRPRALQGLHHGFFGADAFEHGIRADVFRQRLDAGDALFAALGDDVGCAIFESEVLAAFVAAHRDDAVRAHLLGGQHAHKANRAVADNGDRRALLHAGGIGGVPAGAEHVRYGKIACDQVIVGQLGRGDQRAVRERNPRERRLRPAHELALSQED